MFIPRRYVPVLLFAVTRGDRGRIVVNSWWSESGTKILDISILLIYIIDHGTAESITNITVQSWANLNRRRSSTASPNDLLFFSGDEKWCTSTWKDFVRSLDQYWTRPYSLGDTISSTTISLYSRLLKRYSAILKLPVLWTRYSMMVSFDTAYLLKIVKPYSHLSLPLVLYTFMEKSPRSTREAYRTLKRHRRLNDSLRTLSISSMTNCQLVSSAFVRVPLFISIPNPFR